MLCKSSMSGVLILAWEEETLHKEGKKNLDRQALLGFPTQSISTTVPEKSKRVRFRKFPDSNPGRTGKVKMLKDREVPPLSPNLFTCALCNILSNEPRCGPDVEAHACGPSTQEMGVGGSRVQDHHWLQRVFEASLGYLESCVKTLQTKPNQQL